MEQEGTRKKKSDKEEKSEQGMARMNKSEQERTVRKSNEQEEQEEGNCARTNNEGSHGKEQSGMV